MENVEGYVYICLLMATLASRGKIRTKGYNDGLIIAG